MDEAKQMIDECKRLNLWGCKFQLYSGNEIKGNSNEEFLRSIMISSKERRILCEYGKKINQRVFFSVMYPLAISCAKYNDNDFIKIRHKDQNNLDLLELIAEYNYETTCFISTDAPTLFSKLSFIPLYCIPKYPATFEDYEWIMERFEESPYQGISDHCSSTEVLKFFLKLDKKGFYEEFSKEVIYFEKHVCLTKDCLEADWSVTFEELEKALEENND